jgi:hypothetical protein
VHKQKTPTPKPAPPLRLKTSLVSKALRTGGKKTALRVGQKSSHFSDKKKKALNSTGEISALSKVHQA